MNEFGRDVDTILREMGIGDDRVMREDGGGIRAGDLGSIAAEAGGRGMVNCYPGEPGGGCHSLAYFFSLKNPETIHGRGHLSFKIALDKLVKHLTGSCKGQTKAAVFITDNWDPVVFNEWRFTILNLKKECLIEFYLIVNGQKVVMPI